MKKEKFSVKTVKCAKCGKQYKEVITKEMKNDIFICEKCGLNWG